MGGAITLPRETCYLFENLGGCLERGAQEELGYKINIKGYLGSVISFFKRDDNSNIEKTTVYFLGKVLGKANKKPKLDEIDNNILWLEPKMALEDLRENDNEEFKVIERYLLHKDI